MSMISVAWPLMTAEPRMPGVSLPTWMSSRSSTMSTISSTTRPIERPASENTSSGCAPSVRTRTSSLTRISGISWPRYCTRWRPLESSIFLQSISSSRVTSDSGTAFGWCEPARNTSSETVFSTCRLCCASVASSSACVPAEPTVCAMPFGSMIMITEPSPRIVLPENIAM